MTYREDTLKLVRQEWAELRKSCPACGRNYNGEPCKSCTFILDQMLLKAERNLDNERD